MVAMTQYQGKKMNIMGTNGWEMKVGKAVHSTARSHNHLCISASVQFVKFILLPQCPTKTSAGA